MVAVHPAQLRRIEIARVEITGDEGDVGITQGGANSRVILPVDTRDLARLHGLCQPFPVSPLVAQGYHDLRRFH